MDDLELVRYLVGAYLSHAQKHPCEPAALMRRIDGILDSKCGQRLLDGHRALLRARAWKQVTQSQPGTGRPRSHPTEVLELAARFARGAHDDDGRPYSDVPGSAFEVAHDRLFAEFGVRIPTHTIRSHHQVAKG
jgi:hypothetical protein